MRKGFEHQISLDTFRKKNIAEICGDINLIINNLGGSVDYRHFFLHLNEALAKGISLAEIELICEAAKTMAITKNRIIRHLEKDFWHFINKIPFQIVNRQGLTIDEDEELSLHSNCDHPGKMVLARLVRLAQDILALKDDQSKGSALRWTGSLRLLLI